MCKKNLFGDMTSGKMRQRLQEVSEYMDEVINERKKQLRQRNLKRDDLPADPMWNLAHDVLEIIHCPVSKPVEDLTLVIAEWLAEMLNKNVHDPAEVRGLSKRELIFVLVSNHGWEYNDARNFVEFYW